MVRDPGDGLQGHGYGPDHARAGEGGVPDSGRTCGHPGRVHASPSAGAPARRPPQPPDAECQATGGRNLANRLGPYSVEDRIVTNFADEQRDELTTAVKLLTRQIESLTEKLDEVALAIENQPSAFSAELGMLADDETVMAIRELPGALTELADRLPDEPEEDDN